MVTVSPPPPDHRPTHLATALFPVPVPARSTSLRNRNWEPTSNNETAGTSKSVSTLRGTAKDLPTGRGRIAERLSVDGIAQAFKRVAKWIKMPAEEVAQVSGHSIRVGATQDLLALNIDLASVMQAGRWKTNRMPMRYGEQVLSGRGGMARAAEAQGRDRD